MKFRVARHTTDLARIVTFYTQILGLKVLGSFEAHEGYDGVFVGKTGADWHLEFTASVDIPEQRLDEDDYLVFYASDKAEMERVLAALKHQGIPLIQAKNPYWNKEGTVFVDPDGFKVIITLSV